MKRTLLHFCLILTAISVPVFAIAADTPQTMTGVQFLAPLTDSTNSTAPTDVPGFVNFAVKILIGFAAVLAIVMIIIGGVQYMSTDAWTGKSEGKEKIKNALWGILLVAGSWLILYTINPAILSISYTSSIETTESLGGVFRDNSIALVKDKNEPTPGSSGTFYTVTTEDGRPVSGVSWVGKDVSFMPSGERKVYTRTACNNTVKYINSRSSNKIKCAPIKVQ